MGATESEARQLLGTAHVVLSTSAKMHTFTCEFISIKAEMLKSCQVRQLRRDGVCVSIAAKVSHLNNSSRVSETIHGYIQSINGLQHHILSEAVPRNCQTRLLHNIHQGVWLKEVW